MDEGYDRVPGASAIPALKERELKELETIGLRFCSPVIANADAASASDAGVEQESAAA